MWLIAGEYQALWVTWQSTSLFVSDYLIILHIHTDIFSFLSLSRQTNQSDYKCKQRGLLVLLIGIYEVLLGYIGWRVVGEYFLPFKPFQIGGGTTTQNSLSSK